MRTVDFRLPAPPQEQADFAQRLVRFVEEFPRHTDFYGVLGGRRVEFDFDGLLERLGADRAPGVRKAALKEFKTIVGALARDLRKLHREQVSVVLSKKCVELLERKV